MSFKQLSKKAMKKAKNILGEEHLCESLGM